MTKTGNFIWHENRKFYQSSDGESEKMGTGSGNSHAFRAGSAGGITVLLQDVLADLKRRNEPEPSSGGK